MRLASIPLAEEEEDEKKEEGREMPAVAKR